MTVVVWDSIKHGLIFATLKSIDETGVSVPERLSGFREASEFLMDGVSPQVT